MSSFDGRYTASSPPGATTEADNGGIVSAILPWHLLVLLLVCGLTVIGAVLLAVVLGRRPRD